MFNNFRHRSAESQTKMSDSALRDIIPSDDVSLTKESQRSPWLRICKVAMCVVILGVIAIGIVLLALVLIYSGKSFMTFILQSSGMTFLLAANKTVQQENFTDISIEQHWKKITVLATSTHPPIRTLLTMLRTKQENKLLSTNTPSWKSDPTSTMTVTAQSTADTMQTELPHPQSTIPPSTTVLERASITTSAEQTMTTTDPFTSTLVNTNPFDHKASASTELPFITDVASKSPTRKSTKRVFFANHQQLEEENMIDDLLFS